MIEQYGKVGLSHATGTIPLVLKRGTGQEYCPLPPDTTRNMDGFPLMPSQRDELGRVLPLASRMKLGEYTNDLSFWLIDGLNGLLFPGTARQPSAP